MDIKIDNLTTYLARCLRYQSLSPRYCLSRFKVGNEDFRRSSEYTDPANIPFYYYLGKALPAENVLELGFESGIEGGCFLVGCKSVQNFLAFHRRREGYWSPRLPRANIVNVIRRRFDYWHGDVTDPEFLKKFLVKKWDVVLIDKPDTKEIVRRYLDLVWTQMPLGGLIVVESVARSEDVKEAYSEFCTITKRPLTVVNTRNGTGLIVK